MNVESMTLDELHALSEAISARFVTLRQEALAQIRADMARARHYAKNDRRGDEAAAAQAHRRGVAMSNTEKLISLLRALKDSPEHADVEDVPVSKVFLKMAIERLEIVEEFDELNGRLSALLDGVAVAFKGPHPPNGLHSWHDLPEIAARVMADRDALRNDDHLRAIMAKHMGDGHETSLLALPFDVGYLAGLISRYTEPLGK